MYVLLDNIRPWPMTLLTESMPRPRRWVLVVHACPYIYGQLSYAALTYIAIERIR